MNSVRRKDCVRGGVTSLIPCVWGGGVCACSVALSCLTLRSYGLQPSRLCPWNFAGENTGVGCHSLLQGIFSTQGSNPCILHLLHWHVGSLLLEPFSVVLFWKVFKEDVNSPEHVSLKKN